MRQNILQSPAFRRYGSKIFRILVLLLLGLVVFLLLNPARLSGAAIPQYNGTHGYAEPVWVFQQGDTVIETQLSTPAFRHLQKGETYSISVLLTYDGRQDRIPYCFYFVDHMFCRASLDGQVLFSYMPEDIDKPDKSKSPGNVYASFQLPRDCLGKKLVIEFVPALDADIEYQLPNPVFGDYSSQAVHTFWNELVHNTIVILAAFLGVVTIFFSTLILSGSKYREGMFIGIFAILFSLYNLTESDFDFYVLSNPYLTYQLDYTTFTLAPIFLMAFLRERLDPRQQPIVLTMILIALGMYTAEVVLHYSGTMDMREFLPILHIVYFISFVILFVLLATMKKNRRKTQLLLQMVPILIGLLIDVSVYYLHWDLSTSDSTCTAIGMIIFLIVEMYHAWKYSIEIYTESVRSNAYRKMAYIDALTGIGNRRAFDMEKKAITEKKKNFSTLLIASIDVNDLKQTNDTFGHAAGDFIIRNAANVLADLSEDYGSAFRIGGDEFIVFFYDMDQDVYASRLKQMEQKIKQINSNSEAKLSLALGYEAVSSSHLHLDAAIEKADKRMYDNKAARKAALAAAEK